MAQIADKAILINVDIQQWAVAAQRDGDFCFQCKMFGKQRRDGHISDNVAIINNDAFFIGNQIFNIFDTARCIQKVSAHDGK